MRFTSWAIGLTLAGATLLTACGGSKSSSSNTNVRLLNASVGYASLDLTVNNTAINSNVAYGSVGAYSSISTGATSSLVQASGVGSTVAALTPTLTGSSNYTMIAYGWGGTVRTSLLQEAEPVADANKSKLLFLNLAPDAGALDLYLTAANNTNALDGTAPVATNILGGGSSGYNIINSGSYRVTLTGYNKPADVRLNIPSVTLDSTSVSTLIATATQGGRLVNGLTLKQQGAATNIPSTMARIRVAATMSGNSTVSTTLGSSTLLATTLAPQIGTYQTVAAGAATPVITVNGGPLTVASQTFKAGNDYTLLVYGTPALPQFALISDDNRLPTVAGSAKIRLVNGFASGFAGLTMSLDYTDIASNITPGGASTVTTVSASSGSTPSLLTVRSPTNGSVYSNSTLIVPQGAVFSLFMMGDPALATPLGQLLREDR